MPTIVPGTALSLECLGRVLGQDPSRLLDGRTTITPSVGLITGDLDPFTGSRWLALPVPNAPPTHIFLECLGDDDGPRFLNGRTEDGNVELVPSTDPPFSGTEWEVVPAPNDNFLLRCLGASTQGMNARFLKGNLGDGTVELVQSPGESIFSDTRWRAVDGQPIPNGGLGSTSATSQPNSTPSLAFAAAGVGGPPVVHMAWQAADGRVSVMQDILSNGPQSMSLSHRCIDRPALAFDDTRGGDHRLYLAWTGDDQSINVMSSTGGLVFSGRKILPGRSRFGPGIAAVDGRPIVAWTDTNTGEVLMMNGLDADIFPTGETSIAAPALGLLHQFASEPLILAWTGTDPDQRLNVKVGEEPPFPPRTKTTLDASGPNAATSDSGPSLDFKVGPGGAGFLVLGWTGRPGGEDHDTHLNIIFSAEFSIFSQRRTVAPISRGGLAVIDAFRQADGDMLAAWVDKSSPDARVNTAAYNSLPVIAA